MKVVSAACYNFSLHNCTFQDIQLNIHIFTVALPCSQEKVRVADIALEGLCHDPQGTKQNHPKCRVMSNIPKPP